MEGLVISSSSMLLFVASHQNMDMNFAYHQMEHRTANYGMHDPFKLHHLKHIDEVPYKTKWESHFHFDEDLFNNCEDNKHRWIFTE